MAVLVNSANPTAGCYLRPDAVSCTRSRPVVAGAICRAGRTGGSRSSPTATDGITADNASTFTCGTGPCEYLAVGSGLNGSYNDVTPKFSNVALSDTWSMPPNLVVRPRVRYDNFQYGIP